MPQSGAPTLAASVGKAALTEDLSEDLEGFTPAARLYGPWRAGDVSPLFPGVEIQRPLSPPRPIASSLTEETAG
jgi:hypothetical protein